MSLKLSLDQEACNGNALCALEAPTLFAVDEATGLGVLLSGHLEDNQRSDAEAAVRVCPARAIALNVEAG